MDGMDLNDVMLSAADVNEVTTGSVIAFPIIRLIWCLLTRHAFSNQLLGRFSLIPVSFRSWGTVRYVPAAGR